MSNKIKRASSSVVHISTPFSVAITVKYLQNCFSCWSFRTQLSVSRYLCDKHTQTRVYVQTSNKACQRKRVIKMKESYKFHFCSFASYVPPVGPLHVRPDMRRAASSVPWCVQSSSVTLLTFREFTHLHSSFLPKLHSYAACSH